MQNVSKLRTLNIELAIEDEEGNETVETYRIRELPTHLKVKMYNWQELPEDAFYTIFASCVIDSDGNTIYTEQDVEYLEPDIVAHVVTEIQELSQDRKIKVSKKKN